MAIMPHCVVCGFPHPSAGSVRFADYSDSWQPPDYVGWSNSLGVTAAEGVGLFCEEHLVRAEKLRHLPSSEAVNLMIAGDDLRSGPRWLRRLLRRGDR